MGSRPRLIRESGSLSGAQRFRQTSATCMSGGTSGNCGLRALRKPPPLRFRPRATCTARSSPTCAPRSFRCLKKRPFSRWPKKTWLILIVPLTIVFIFAILYTMFRSYKWALLILGTAAMAPLGGLVALLVGGTHFSVSSGIGFLALFGVSVQVGVIMLEYINQLRARGHSIEDSAIAGAVLRVRLLSVFLLPTLYVWVAGEGDKLRKWKQDLTKQHKMRGLRSSWLTRSP
ncbi:MAG: hypothetical protein DMG41_20085 [Acidobacteria bacterium]|nr:MAG: hypothetical protein DMG41_20085 [Acidobacteriota bacterium]